MSVSLVGSEMCIRDRYKTLKTADLNNMGATVKDASGSYGEFLRVDFTKNYGDLGANMQAVKNGPTMEMTAHVLRHLPLTEQSLLLITGCIKVWESS